LFFGANYRLKAWPEKWADGSTSNACAENTLYSR